MITLTHANFNVPVDIYIHQLAAKYESAANKCTHVILVGAIVPVKETRAEIDRLVLAYYSSVQPNNK